MLLLGLLLFFFVLAPPWAVVVPGTVRLRGELWQERSDDDAGVAVRVQAVDGLTLVVAANGRRP